MVWNKETLAAVIDHTLLKPQAKPEDIERLCEEAINYHFASVCINPCYVSMASKILSGTGVKTCTVIGFPLGANETSIKVKEAQKAIEQGASEIDMVINVGMLKSKKLAYVGNEIKEIVDIATKGNAIVKVIIETCLLEKEEKITACKLAVENGAVFVKTSTGFNGPGAQVSDVALMRETVGYKIGVKASGGIRDYQTAVAMLEAGASRIGTSAGVAIIETIKDS
ncbi:MAG: deoxyribose-phosphate aldolase [Moorella sp. (in: firmicutes)]|uniref:Deoxyribose-phosphate aldolase n=1 Tax=Neomoorella thermoacetica TaxID=1525 RepID=A0A1J5P3G8_NEOTH|nr:deoxyribose-phosphate aldolase [Moorella sp. (in: firmicutes)]OIQ58485.1 deoxyribose-phosphate aldolase [Moorella thermoacetica]